MRLFANQSNMT